MPIIDKAQVLRGAFLAATQIHAHAVWLAGQSGSIPFDSFSARMDAMRDAWSGGGQPLLDLGTAATVNLEVGRFFAGTPADTYQSFADLRAALVALYTAYDAVFGSLTPIQHTPGGGHSYAAIPLSSLSALADEISAVITAAAKLKV